MTLIALSVKMVRRHARKNLAIFVQSDTIVTRGYFSHREPNFLN